MPFDCSTEISSQYQTDIINSTTYSRQISSLCQVGYINPWIAENTYGCILHTLVTDAQVLKHQATINTNSAEHMFIVLTQFYTNILHLQQAV